MSFQAFSFFSRSTASLVFLYPSTLSSTTRGTSGISSMRWPAQDHRWHINQPHTLSIQTDLQPPLKTPSNGNMFSAFEREEPWFKHSPSANWDSSGTGLLSRPPGARQSRQLSVQNVILLGVRQIILNVHASHTNVELQAYTGVMYHNMCNLLLCIAIKLIPEPIALTAWKDTTGWKPPII